VDGWLNLPQLRFSQNPAVPPAAHFYEHAIRFEEMFERLILPLKQNRRHFLLAAYTEETATAYRQHLYQFEDVDVILLEGIFLFKPAYRNHFELKLWVDCSFETALARALQRGQEGLPPAETIQAYNTLYFPAQRLHFALDDPRAAADLILVNEPGARLAADEL
jgi:uridine kinase